MLERTMQSNEIISLTLLLLMIMALVASQADATMHEQAAAEMTQRQYDRGMTDAPLRATIEGHINGIPLTISIDTTADFGRLLQQSP